MALEAFKEKAGPLPLWGWGAILLGGLLGWSVLSRGRKGQAADASSQPVDTVPADQVPDFISQVYTTVNNSEPAAPPSKTTLPAPVDTPPITPPKRIVTPPHITPPAPVVTRHKAPLQYKVKHGDTLSSIAKRYGTSWQSLWQFNTTKGNRPDSTIATLKKRGPNLLYAGETILIPQK